MTRIKNLNLYFQVQLSVEFLIGEALKRGAHPDDRDSVTDMTLLVSSIMSILPKLRILSKYGRNYICVVYKISLHYIVIKKLFAN